MDLVLVIEQKQFQWYDVRFSFPIIVSYVQLHLMNKQMASIFQFERYVAIEIISLIKNYSKSIIIIVGLTYFAISVSLIFTLRTKNPGTNGGFSCGNTVDGL